ncbi:MAG: type II toxin-antitoxin system PemK/MazF family toxin [Candidatus Coatesbacteria bacterium]|nr:type II toxin-antitoxin system PemK/MazF family toxin [Candidatus Coatesbacteria bacterium]
MAKISRNRPDRAEVWLVSLDPTVGAEIRKSRPAVVMSRAGMATSSLRIIVPIMRWKSFYEGCFWKIHISPERENGLSKVSAADAFQVRSVSLKRFVKRLGILPDEIVSNIAKAIALCIDLELRS